MVLDLGCGEGKLLGALAPKISRGIGIDLSSIALDRGRQLLADYKIENIELCCEDFRNMELDPQSVDAAVSVWALHHISGDAKRAVINKIANVLVPGGSVYIEDDTFNFPREHFDTMVPAMYREFEERFGAQSWEILKRDLDGEDFERTP